VSQFDDAYGGCRKFGLTGGSSNIPEKGADGLCPPFCAIKMLESRINPTREDPAFPMWVDCFLNVPREVRIGNRRERSFLYGTPGLPRRRDYSDRSAVALYYDFRAFAIRAKTA